eukprot:1922-Heterococcus_DN1.PRE.4
MSFVSFAEKSHTQCCFKKNSAAPDVLCNVHHNMNIGNIHRQSQGFATDAAAHTQELLTRINLLMESLSIHDELRTAVHACHSTEKLCLLCLATSLLVLCHTALFVLVLLLLAAAACMHQQWVQWSRSNTHQQQLLQLTT